MNKVHGTTTLTFSDGSERCLPNRDVLTAAADLTSDASSPILALFRECTGAKSTSGHLHELIFAYLNGPVATREELVN